MFGYLQLGRVSVHVDKRCIAPDAAGQGNAPAFKRNEHIQYLQLVENLILADENNTPLVGVDVPCEIDTVGTGSIGSRPILLMEVDTVKPEGSQPPAQPAEGRGGGKIQFSCHNQQKCRRRAAPLYPGRI